MTAAQGTGEQVRWSWALLVLTALTSCLCGSSRVLYGSAGDVDAMLHANGVTATVSACRNVRLGGSIVRRLSCEVTLTPGEVAALVSSMPMKRAPEVAVRAGYTDTCESRPGFASTAPGVQVLVGTNTAVPNGVGRVELRVVAAGGRGCIEVEYPSG